MKKSMRLAKIFGIVASVALLPSTVFAQNTSNVVESTYNNESILISETEDAKYYVTNDKLIKVEVESDIPTVMRSANVTEDSEITKNSSSIISFFTTDLNDEEREELLKEKLSITKNNFIC